MAERIIAHPLRTIRLVFDDQKDETAADTELLTRYVKLHDELLDLRTRFAKLRFDHFELNDTLQAAQRSFHDIGPGMNALIAESEVLLTKVRREDDLGDLMQRMSDYHDFIEVFQDGHVEALHVAVDAQSKAWKAFEGAEARFDELFIAYEKEVDRPYFLSKRVHALEPKSYHDDMEELKGLVIKLAEQQDLTEITQNYYDLIEEVAGVFARWTDAQAGLHLFFADDGILDRSLSEACQRGEIPKDEQPRYMVQPDHLMVQRFIAEHGSLADKENTLIKMGVAPSVVETGEPTMVLELVMALQHFPRLMEKMLYKFDFVFLTAYNTPLDEADWKGKDGPMRWIHLHSTLPSLYFFLSDQDVRHYIPYGRYDVGWQASAR